MKKVVVDYIIRSGGGVHSVVRRSCDLSTSWLTSSPVSRHRAKDDALFEAEWRNRMMVHEHV